MDKVQLSYDIYFGFCSNNNPYWHYGLRYEKCNSLFCWNYRRIINDYEHPTTTFVCDPIDPDIHFIGIDEAIDNSRGVLPESSFEYVNEWPSQLSLRSNGDGNLVWVLEYEYIEKSFSSIEIIVDANNGKVISVSGRNPIFEECYSSDAPPSPLCDYFE